MSSEEHESNERRRSGRGPIELRVEYKRMNTFFADYTRNISRGGTFIGTTRPLPAGTTFLFSLAVPGLAEPLRLRGHVIWVTSAEEATAANPAGMGIEFQYEDEQERLRTEATVERLMREQLGERLVERLLGRPPHRA